VNFQTQMPDRKSKLRFCGWQECCGKSTFSGTRPPLAARVVVRTWSSGSNTSASLILHDFQLSTTGNDFGIANISVSSVPEPSAFALAVVGAGGVLAWGWMRRKAGIRSHRAA
jgi:hypothetical protein